MNKNNPVVFDDEIIKTPITASRDLSHPVTSSNAGGGGGGGGGH